jgi:heptosyltransferase-2
MNVGIFLPNWVGDACMATPTLRALKRGLARNTRLIGIGRPGPMQLLEGTPWLDQAVVYQPRGRLGVLSTRQLVLHLRRCKLDAAVLLTNSLSSALIAAVAGARRRIGYARDLRSWLLTDRLPVPKMGWRPHPIAAIDYYLALAQRMGCPSVDREMDLAISATDQAMADELWDRCHFEPGRNTVVVNSGGAFGQSKVWPQSHVKHLALRLANEARVQVLLHCGPKERLETNALAESCRHPLIHSMGKMESLPLGLSKAALARAAVVVSTDSGPRHIGVALNRPVVSLFGPTEPAWTITYNRPEIIASEELACQPCYARTCPLKHHRCMQKLSVDRIFKATLLQLAGVHQDAIGTAHGDHGPQPSRFAA